MAGLMDSAHGTVTGSGRAAAGKLQALAIRQVGESWREKSRTGAGTRREALVFAVEDQPRFAPGLQVICEFLGVKLEQVNSEDDLAPLLRTRKPMAVFCELDNQSQDGCHVMKIVADHDHTLPILMVVGDDPNLLGAAQAVEEIFQLTEFTICPRLPGIGKLVEFLFSAGRRGQCLSLMPG